MTLRWPPSTGPAAPHTLAIASRLHARHHLRGVGELDPSATMRVITKWAAISLCLGAAATVLVSLVEYQYCMDGSGHPAHSQLIPGSPVPKRGDEVFSILLARPTAQRPSGLSYPPEVNLLAIIGDLGVWSAAAFFIVGWFRRTRRKVCGKASEE